MKILFSSIGYKPSQKMLVATLLMLSSAVSFSSCATKATKVTPLKLGFEKTGIRIVMVHSGDIQPDVVNKTLRIDSMSGSTLLTHWTQMGNSFNITSGDQALKFVRLRTSLATWFFWQDEPELEIVSQEDVMHLPDFGLARNEISFKTMGSGFSGVLSKDAYLKGGFQPPVVLLTPHGYRIVRWIFTRDAVEKIREDVDAKGFYSMRVLERKSPPHLPETRWAFPTFA